MDRKKLLYIVNGMKFNIALMEGPQKIRCLIDLRYQGIQHLKAGGIHNEDFRVMSMAEEPALLLVPNRELVELNSKF